MRLALKNALIQRGFDDDDDDDDDNFRRKNVMRNQIKHKYSNSKGQSVSRNISKTIGPRGSWV